MIKNKKIIGFITLFFITNPMHALIVDLENQYATRIKCKVTYVNKPDQNFGLGAHLKTSLGDVHNLKSISFWIKDKEYNLNGALEEIRESFDINSEETVTITIEEEEIVPTIDEQLKAINKGSLGVEYAKMAREICDADYTVAKQQGFIDLCDQLQKTLIEPEYVTSPTAREYHTVTNKYPIEKPLIKPRLKPTTDEVKEAIIMLRKKLNWYKEKGIVQ